MNSTFDDEMRRVYARLERDHERLREELMASLPRERPCAEEAARPAPRRRWTGFSFMKRRVFPVSIGIAAAVALVIGFWPGHEKSSLVWADVARQLQSARTAHLRIVSTDSDQGGGREFTQDMYIKSPGKARAEGIEPSTGHRRVIAVNGERAAILSPDEKQYDTAPNTILPASSVEDILTLLCAPKTLSGPRGA